MGWLCNATGLKREHVITSMAMSGSLGIHKSNHVREARMLPIPLMPLPQQPLLEQQWLLLAAALPASPLVPAAPGL